MKETWPGHAGLDPRKFLFSTTRIMQAVGLLQSPDLKWPRTYRLYRSVILLLVLQQTLSQVMDFILHSRTLTTIAQNGIFTLLSLNSSFKALWLWKKQSVVLALLADMTENFRLVPPLKSGSQNLDTINKGVRNAYISFLNLTTTAWLYWITNPFLVFASELYHHDASSNKTLQISEMEYGLPARAWYPYEVFYYPMYWFAYSFQFVSLTYIVFISISVDLLCIVTLLRINAQLLFLVADLETASENALAVVMKNQRMPSILKGEDLAVGVPVEDYTKELIKIARTCVFYHVDVIR